MNLIYTKCAIHVVHMDKREGLGSIVCQKLAHVSVERKGSRTLQSRKLGTMLLQSTRASTIQPYVRMYFCRPKSVTERLICHAIIGKNAHKERIMTVDVLANFISPLTQFSSREISFTSHQVHSVHIQYLYLTAVLLTLSSHLEVS